MSDYTAEWPLWVGNANINVTADHLGLSTALARRLWDWERLFNAHYSHETGGTLTRRVRSMPPRPMCCFVTSERNFVPRWLCLSTCGRSGKLSTPTSTTDV